MLTISLFKSYRKSDGNGDIKRNDDGTAKVNFIYRVTGPDEELAQFEAIQRAKQIEVSAIKDEQSHLWFTSTPVGLEGTLRISKGNIYADTTDLDMYQALIKTYGRVGELMVENYLTQVPEDQAVAEVTSDLTMPE